MAALEQRSRRVATSKKVCGLTHLTLMHFHDQQWQMHIGMCMVLYPMVGVGANAKKGSSLKDVAATGATFYAVVHAPAMETVMDDLCILYTFARVR
jgi:hypothetical protein